MTAYFVTGATGFIGRHLVERLLEREGDIHVLVREGSREKLEALVRERGPRQAGDRRHPRAEPRRRPERAAEDRPLLPPRRDLRHGRRRGAQCAAERRRHQERDRPRERARGRALPPHVVDRGRRRLRRRHVQRGHVRRGSAADPPVSPHEVRVREARPQERQQPVARLPPITRRRRQPHRPDGQDRRAVLLLQADPEGPQDAAAVVPADLDRVGLDQHRPGRLRRRRSSTTSPTRTGSTARPSTSSTRRASASARS